MEGGGVALLGFGLLFLGFGLGGGGGGGGGGGATSNLVTAFLGCASGVELNEFIITANPSTKNAPTSIHTKALTRKVLPMIVIF